MDKEKGVKMRAVDRGGWERGIHKVTFQIYLGKVALSRENL